MAFKATVTTDYGSVIQNCYVVVECEKSSTKHGGVRIEAIAYLSQEYRQLNKPIPGVNFIHLLKRDDSEYAPFEEGFLKAEGSTDAEQAYKYVKNMSPLYETQIDFAHAEDC